MLELPLAASVTPPLGDRPLAGYPAVDTLELVAGPGMEQGGHSQPMTSGKPAACNSCFTICT